MNKIELLRLALLTLEQAESKGNCEYEVTGLIRAALAKPEPEPIAWLDPWAQKSVTLDYEAYGVKGIPLYTAPPQREWVELTDEELVVIRDCAWIEDGDYFSVAVAIEQTAAKLKERNT